MRVLMTGGGTGGHVNPALAIANTIRTNIPGSEIAFVGTPRGIENKLVPKEGYRLYHVEMQGLRRSLSLSNFKTAYLMLTSPKRAAEIIREFEPDIVIGTGGYVCWPLIKAASKLGIPTALHESNAVPGAAVKALEKYTDRIFLNFKETEQYLKHPEKLMHVGNPLRASFGCESKSSARAKADIGSEYKYVVLSYGGSLGAEHLNEAMLRIMKSLAVTMPDTLFIHGAGSRRYADMKAKFDASSASELPNIRICDYIYNMPTVMAAADIVISRSGAMSVSELSMMGKCAIFVPSPNVTNNHQYKNAKVLSDAGAASLVEDSALDSDVLENEIYRFIENPDLRREREERIRAFSVADANKRIFEEIVRMTKK